MKEEIVLALFERTVSRNVATVVGEHWYQEQIEVITGFERRRSVKTSARIQSFRRRLGIDTGWIARKEYCPELVEKKSCLFLYEKKYCVMWKKVGVFLLKAA